MEEIKTFSPQRKKNKPARVMCSVKNCGNKMSENKNIIFHKFPKQNRQFLHHTNQFGEIEKIDKHDAWKKILKLTKVTTYTNVCSNHFTKDDYLLEVSQRQRNLKRNAVPSVNLPDDEYEQSVDIMNKDKLAQFSIKSEKNLEQTQESVCENSEESNNSFCCVDIKVEDLMEVNYNQDFTFEERMECTKSEAELFLHDTSTQTETASKDISIQVNTFFHKPRFMSFIKNDINLSAWTGLESFNLLNYLVKIIKIKVMDKYEKNSDLNTKDRVILTYIKLKMDLPYQNVATLFHISARHCQRVFFDMIKLLRVCFEQVVLKWPSKEEISKNIPKCFEEFENVRVVLYCTEIFVQRPANLNCQTLSYSHYKGAATLKFMTAMSPAGNITFISKAYDGRVSNSQIFNESDLKSLLEPGDAIMVDKGFLIEEICEKNKWKLICPPFVKDKKQFTKTEMELSDKIAAARVHVERSSQRLKNFKVLNSKLSSVLFSLAEDIFIVISATVNLRSPILDND